ncbi:MAG TPA: PE domain-containing protein [Mycobacteriales bacterium]|nr:PE domain-containing protein [Mycobacteriales bacterium]
MTDLDVDPERLRTAADKLEAAVERMDADLAALEQEATTYQQACGSDGIGMAISSCYEAIYEMALDSYSANLGELISYARDLDTMADTYDTAEQSNKAAFDAIDPGTVP